MNQKIQIASFVQNKLYQLYREQNGNCISHTKFLRVPHFSSILWCKNCEHSKYCILVGFCMITRRVNSWAAATVLYNCRYTGTVWYMGVIKKNWQGTTMRHARGQVQFFSVLSGVAASWMLKKIYQFCRVDFDQSWFFLWTERQSPPHDGAGIIIDHFLSIIKVEKSNNRISLLLCLPWKDQGTKVDQEEEN